MGARRDDMTSQHRTQIALTVLSPHRPRGTVTRLARDHSLSRQTIYQIALAAQHLLQAGLVPSAHGAPPPAPTISVDRNRLVRSTLVLTRSGVSQRDVAECLAELLDAPLSPTWVRATLTRMETVATSVNANWHPAIGEVLAGDEIFSHGQPNLLVVGTDSLYLYALTRQPHCDGLTWGCVLLDTPECPQFASDAGPGLLAGATLAALPVQQRDWDHLLRPLWGQVARLETRAYAALTALETRAALFDQAHTPGRLAQHLAAWERLRTDADAQIRRYDAFHTIAQQVDAWFALIDLPSGQLRDPQVGATALRTLGAHLASWSGRIYGQISRALIDLAADLFHYVPVLAHALAPLRAQWGADGVAALARIWQIEAEGRRHARPWDERAHQQRLWRESLDTAVALIGEERLWAAWEAVCAVLGRSWRGSMLAECVNSLLRPLLAGRKQTDQGYLELVRFLHNVHRFARGKRKGQSPAELVGMPLPDDPLTLLGLAPKVSI